MYYHIYLDLEGPPEVVREIFSYLRRKDVDWPLDINLVGEDKHYAITARSVLWCTKCKGFKYKDPKVFPDVLVPILKQFNIVIKHMRFLREDTCNTKTFPNL